MGDVAVVSPPAPDAHVAPPGATRPGHGRSAP